MGAGLEEADWGGGTGGEYAELSRKREPLRRKIFGGTLHSYLKHSKDKDTNTKSKHQFEIDEQW